MNSLTRWLNKVTRPKNCYMENYVEEVQAHEETYKALRALVIALDEYGQGQSMKHPRLTRAILRAKKHLE